MASVHQVQTGDSSVVPAQALSERAVPEFFRGVALKYTAVVEVDSYADQTASFAFEVGLVVTSAGLGTSGLVASAASHLYPQPSADPASPSQPEEPAACVEVVHPTEHTLEAMAC